MKEQEEEGFRYSEAASAITAYSYGEGSQGIHKEEEEEKDEEEVEEEDSEELEFTRVSSRNVGHG